MNIKPLNDRVVVAPEVANEKTAGGIYLPENAKEKPLMGTVVSVGSGKLLDNGKRSPMSVSKGDMVAFGQYSGSEVKIDGVEYKILHESEILGVIEK